MSDNHQQSSSSPLPPKIQKCENNPIPSTSMVPTKAANTAMPNKMFIHEAYIAVKNFFVSEIKKWSIKWIDDKHQNPFYYTVRHLDTDFTDLCTFQQFVLNFSLVFFLLSIANGTNQI